VLLAQI